MQEIKPWLMLANGFDRIARKLDSAAEVLGRAQLWCLDKHHRGEVGADAPSGEPSSPPHVYVPAKRTEPLRAKRDSHYEHDQPGDVRRERYERWQRWTAPDTELGGPAA